MLCYMVKEYPVGIKIIYLENFICRWGRRWSQHGCSDWYHSRGICCLVSVYYCPGHTVYLLQKDKVCNVCNILFKEFSFYRAKVIPNNQRAKSVFIIYMRQRNWLWDFVQLVKFIIWGHVHVCIFRPRGF